MFLWIMKERKFKELLRYICWGIWIFRNDAMFNNRKQTIVVVSSKIIAYILEHNRDEK